MTNTTDRAAIGILMLESHFPRILGDIGNPLTWPFPVRYKIVKGASPDRVVRQQDHRLLQPFIDSALELVAEGALGITTSCGFLALFQKELAQALPLPVITSSLMQVDAVNKTLSTSKRVGILTISASHLTKEVLAAAGVPDGTPIGSTESGTEFTRTILNDEPEMDIEKARQDNVEAALQLQRENPDLGAIVLECTNMPPYADDIRAATSLPVYSIITLVTWFHAALSSQYVKD